MHRLATSSASFSRWTSIRSALGFTSHTIRGGRKERSRRKFSFESLEERSLLSVCHWSGSVDNTWSNPQNWDFAPRAGDELVFQGSGITTQNDLTDRTTFKSIKFASDGFTLTGNAVWVNEGIAVDAGVANATIALDVALGGTVAIEVSNASASLTISRVLSGGGSLLKAGLGTLNLNAANTYCGGTTVNDGTVVLGDDSALGAAYSAVNVDGGAASLNLNGHSPTVGKLILTEGSIVPGNSAATITSSSIVVMNGTISANLAGNGGLTKITNDAVTLSGLNTYSGVTTVTAGTLELGPSAQNCVLNLGGSDLEGGKIVFRYANGTSPAATIRSKLMAGYHGGLWDVGEFKSSTANATRLTLGWLDNGENAVSVMPTYSGDCNLDGVVNLTDLNVLKANFGSGTTWGTGDVNYDGSVNLLDLNLRNANAGLPSVGDNFTAKLAVSGSSTVNEGATYTLTLGQVTGAGAHSYIIDWGDGTGPQTYTAAEIDACNRQVTHAFAGGINEPLLTVTLIDEQGRIIYSLAGQCVAVSTLAAPVSQTPNIRNFLCVNDFADMWTLTGTVTDRDDLVKGDVITFGGVFAGFNLTATVEADGTFSLTAELHGLQTGEGTAQTTDPHGVLSNLASCWIVNYEIGEV
jgi:autotransporter-associated beta strand protein